MCKYIKAVVIENNKINMALNDQPFIEYKNGEILN